MTTTHCSHHWIIETPDGPVSMVRCRLCGEAREFSNSVEIGAGNWKLQPRQYPGQQSEVEGP